MLKKFVTVSTVLWAAASFPAFASGGISGLENEVLGTMQDNKCTGLVKDAAGEGVIGASVTVKGAKAGTITNIDGNFSLAGVKKGDVIRISYVGYEPAEVVWNGTPLTVTLKDNSAALQEVVVTAMGIKKDAKKLGYAVSSITADDLTRTGTPNFATALYGKASGVRISAAPGGSTSAVSITVRGLSSITGNTQPLIVMDGVPIHNGNANNSDYWSNQRVQSNGLVDINPEDIANISILKGAAASALYGSEAANGVVMITTKSGKAGAGVGVDFGVDMSFSPIAYMPEIQKEYGPGYDNALVYSNGTDYEKQSGGFYQFDDYNGNKVVGARSTYYNWGPKYDGREVYYFDNKYRAYSPIAGNPWNQIFRTAFNQTYNLAITAGGDKNTIRFAYTYNNELPNQLASRNDKHTFALTGTTRILNNLKIDYSVNYMRWHIQNRTYRMSRLLTNYNGMFGGFTDIAYLRDHTVTSRGYLNVVHGSDTSTPDEDFAYNGNAAYSGLVGEYFWNIFGKKQEENNNRFIASVTPSWEIIPGLTLRGRLSTDLTANTVENRNNTEKANRFSTNGQYTGSYGIQNDKYEIYYGDVMLMFDRTFAKKYNITANIGWSGREEDYYMTSTSTNGGLSVENWFNLAASTLKANSSMQKTAMLKTALFGTASFGYDSWGYLEGTIRQEKSSTLGPDNNTFVYPSANASVILTELLKNKKPSWWDYGKIRVSYGIVGNSPTLYDAMEGFTQDTKSGYVMGYIGTALGNNKIKPEKKYEFELGFESKFFQNRLGFELSYYHNTIKDQILRTSTAASQGAQSILMNVGELENKGVELSLYGTPVQTKDWQWDLNLNLSWNKNKVTKLAEGLDRLEHRNIDNGAAVLESHVGEPMGQWYVYKIARDANGNKIVDTNGVYKVDYSERKAVGSAMPDLTGGFSTSLSYKSFSLNATVDFRIGGYVMNQPWQYMNEIGNLKSSLANRDPEHGGLLYYAEGNNLKFGDRKLHLVTDKNVKVGDKIDGNVVYGNGVILPGVKEDGTPNDIIVTAGETHYNQYGWGYTGNITYEDAVQKNTYFKMRELSLGYTLPSSLTKKFGCKRLTVSVYGRNLFYFYKSLKDFDAEAVDGTSWIYQAAIGGATATTRTFGFSLRATF